MAVEPSVATLQELHMPYWRTENEVKSNVQLRSLVVNDLSHRQLMLIADCVMWYHRPAWPGLHTHTPHRVTIQNPAIPLPATPRLIRCLAHDQGSWHFMLHCNTLADQAQRVFCTSEKVPVSHISTDGVCFPSALHATSAWLHISAL